ncbi:B subunit of topoisomerase VI, partial [Helicosporidium sp. ATCC 50920]
RGKFGLGAKMALIWSKMSTGLPITVSAAQAVRKRAKGSRGGREEAELGPLVLSPTVSRYVLDIDIRRNEPSVHSEAREPNAEGWHGAEVSVTIAGAWTYYRAKVLKYLQQIAVITPYTRFRLRYVPAGAGGGAEGSTLGDAGCSVVPESKGILNLEFSRRTNTMPPRPRQVRHHPSSVDLELVRRLASLSGASSLAAFLVRDFDCVSPELADRILAEAGDAVAPEAPPKELDPRGAARLHQLFHEIRFPDPDGRHLSPAGEYNLRLGILKEIAPDLVATCAGEPRVADGHAFVVEAGLALGGREVRPGINVYRFANRIPLLFEEGSDVITRTARKRINWSSYKINQTTDRVSVFVSIVSTKIPFKGAGKEYIADDVEEIQHAVRAAIQLCCVQLKSKIVRQQAAREQKQRKKTLVKYVPDVARAVAAFLNTVAQRAKDKSIGACERVGRTEGL